MDIDLRRTALLVVFLLFTSLGAFLLGRGKSRGSEGETRTGQGAALPANEANKAASAVGATTPSRSKTDRSTNTVARFLSAARFHSNDELARLLPEIAEKMNLADVQEALARLDKLRPGPARRLARRVLINRMAQLDAEAALATVDAMPESELRSELHREAVKGWASVDPAAAHRWATHEGDPDKDALRAVWEGIAHTHDLDRTLEFIPNLGPGSNNYSEPYEIWDIYMTLHDLYRLDDEKVTAWVEELPPGEVRDRAFHSIVDQIARHDPVAAREWIEEQADVGNRTEAYVELAESWARHDPEAAVAWAADLPPETDGLRRIYERLFTRFLQYDYRDAGDYLAAQEPSPALDTAFEVLIDTTKGSDPEATMDWAAAITDDARRWSAIQEVAGAWRQRDAGALEAYLGTLDITEEQRGTLLEK